MSTEKQAPVAPGTTKTDPAHATPQQNQGDNKPAPAQPTPQQK
jgi:hypothetical protein